MQKIPCLKFAIQVLCSCMEESPVQATSMASHLLDGGPCRLVALKVDETVAPGRAVGVGGHFARQDAPEGAERVVQRLVVDGGVQVLRGEGTAAREVMREGM